MLYAITLLSAGLFSLPCYGATYGNATPFENGSLFRPNFVLGIEVLIPQELQLDSFGVIYGPPEPQTPLSSNAIYALYDATGLGGDPGVLIAKTDTIAVSSTTTYSFEFSSHPVLMPGTYWMMGLYESNANPRTRIPAPGQTAPPFAYFSQSFSAGMPAAAPACIREPRGNINYYITGTPVPEPASLLLLSVQSLTLLVCSRNRSA